MRAWYIPSRTGDFRLETHPDNVQRCLLTVEDPTPDELTRLRKALSEYRSKGWIDELLGINATGRSELVVEAPIAKAGPVLAGDSMPGRGVLTVVRSAKGTVLCVADETQQQVVEQAVADPEPEAPPPKPEERAEVAASVRRPTCCCPDPLPAEGPLKRSSRVLREFCTPRQWKQWVQKGYITFFGGMTGARYRICHRNHPLAAEQGKICRDLDYGVTLHFWDWSIPPAEEVAAAMLILQFREPWLRNEATYFGPGPKLFNPLGNGADGTWDASFFRSIGGLITGDSGPMRRHASGIYFPNTDTYIPIE